MKSRLVAYGVATSLLIGSLVGDAAPTAAQTPDIECDGVAATIIGTPGNDVLDGTNRSDVIVGLGGNDVITGGNGDDLICGGDGVDVIDGGNGRDEVFGGRGDDLVEGGNGKDVLQGGTGYDEVDGGNAKDECGGAESATSCEAEILTPDFLAEGPGGATAAIDGFTGSGPDDVTITYDATLAGPAVADSLASPVYEFMLDHQSLTFDSAVLTIPYDPARIAGDPSGLEIYTYNEAYGLWVPAAGAQTTDVDANTMSVTVEHFSKYAIFDLGLDGFERYWQTKPIFCVRPGEDPTVGLDIAFVVDTSGSMGGNDPTGLRVDAALDIVDRATENDRVAVVGFSSSATIEAELTPVTAANLPTLTAALEATRRAGGGTDITSAVRTATTVLTRETTLQRPRIAVLLTDGLSSYLESATTAAADADVVIYTVALGSSTDTQLLQGIADGTGGLFLQADDAGDIAAIYDDIASGLIDDGSDDDGDGLTNCEERRGMYTTDGFYFTIPGFFGTASERIFIPLPRTITTDPNERDTDGDGVTDDVEMGPPLDLRDDPAIAETYSFLIDAGITRVYNPITDPRVRDDQPPQQNVVEPIVARTWAVPGGVGVAQAGRVGAVSSVGTLVTGAIVGELLVQYFQTFDLDPRFRETYAAHLFPMLADLPGDDLDLQVSLYETLPWVEPATKPYRDDADECLAWISAIGAGMQAFIARRSSNPNLAESASLAVAVYCIDEKIGSAAARSGGPNAVPPDMPGLSINPDGAEQRLAFDGTPQNHAETNVLGSLISGVPIRTSSIGVVYMLVDNPSEGRICGRCITAFEAFKRRYPLVSLTVRARNNAWQDGLYLDEIDPQRYERELSGDL